MNQVNDVERMMTESGIYLLKMYFSISKSEQEKRFADIKKTPTKKWKFSAVDSKAIGLWDQYTLYKEKMFEHTQREVPWKIIKANKKTNARINAMEYILKSIPYVVKDPQRIKHINVINKIEFD
jgi:polyphosphate kinase 2 (PPK2 family)